MFFFFFFFGLNGLEIVREREGFEFEKRREDELKKVFDSVGLGY